MAKQNLLTIALRKNDSWQHWSFYLKQNCKCIQSILKKIGRKLTSSVPHTSKNFKKFIIAYKTFEERVLQEKELEETFKSLKPSKFPGFDDNFSLLVKTDSWPCASLGVFLISLLSKEYVLKLHKLHLYLIKMENIY